MLVSEGTPVNVPVARRLVEGLQNPAVAQEERLRTRPPVELTPFDVMAREAPSDEKQ